MTLFSYLMIIFFFFCVVGTFADERKWTTDEGIQIEIIKKITDSKCKVKSEVGDTLEQFYKLTNKDGKIIGSRASTLALHERGQMKAPSTAGHSVKQIADVVKHSRKAIINFLRHQEEYGTRKSSGRRSKTGDFQGHYASSQKNWINLKAENRVKAKNTHKVCYHVGTYCIFTFVLGRGEVIRGMDIAMEGMCVGEQRKVIIPPDEGFGDDGREMDSIRQGDTLYYFVELKSVFRPNPGDKWITDEGVHITVIHKIDQSECIVALDGDTLHQQYTLHLEDDKYLYRIYFIPDYLICIKTL
uniref:peptidylprolyl isomerase n=1 Tax=Heterorhabditis bacteriophora TaxID=37862 RepID=A0A1I7XMV3_HETBA